MILKNLLALSSLEDDISPHLPMCQGCIFSEMPMDKTSDHELGTITEVRTRDWSLCYGKLCIKNQHHLQFQSTEDIVSLRFQYCGKLTLQDHSNNNEIIFECNQHNISFTPSNIFNWSIHQCPALEFMEVNMKHDYFINFLNEHPDFTYFIDNIKNRKLSNISKINGKITFHIQNLINDIISNNKSGGLKHLYIQSKVLELLLSQLEYFSNNIVLEEHLPHVDKIVKVKNILDNNAIKTPCSLIELAHMVGTNECTLKKGFKELTGNTVFGYWNEVKMKQAYQQVLDTQLPINEIAFEAGYKHHQHFTAAFKKKFGFTPLDIRNRL